MSVAVLRLLTLRPRVYTTLVLSSLRYSTISTALETPETVTIIPPVNILANLHDHSSDTSASLVGHLQSRSLVETLSSDDLLTLSDRSNPSFCPENLSLYCGADPTAQSLHLGNLLPLMVLLHFNLNGHNVYGLVGGATGAVGDPSGRDTERTHISSSDRSDNVSRIQHQIQQFLVNGKEYARSRNFPVSDSGAIASVNNASWWENVGFLDFLSSYGRHIRIGSMLARDSILARLKGQQGLGFNEFSYQVLQAYDFWHLFKTSKVNVQIGGNDQWGNITAGIDFISRVQRVENPDHQAPAFGMTVPLLTTPTGEKFGKSAGNAIFIDTALTSPYQLYQYFINIPDTLVCRLLKTFTLLPLATIESEVMETHDADPGLRYAQRILAREVVDLIHGNGTGDQMAYITGFLFPTPNQPFNDEISAERLVQNFAKSGILQTIRLSDFEAPDIKLSALLAKVMKKSKRETRNLIKSGGIYLGLERKQIEDPEDVILFDNENHLIENRLLLVRVGKQTYHVVVVEP